MPVAYLPLDKPGSGPARLSSTTGELGEIFIIQPSSHYKDNSLAKRNRPRGLAGSINTGGGAIFRLAWLANAAAVIFVVVVVVVVVAVAPR